MDRKNKNKKSKGFSSIRAGFNRLVGKQSTTTKIEILKSENFIQDERVDLFLQEERETKKPKEKKKKKKITNKQRGDMLKIHPVNIQDPSTESSGRWIQYTLKFIVI